MGRSDAGVDHQGVRQHAPITPDLRGDQPEEVGEHLPDVGRVVVGRGRRHRVAGPVARAVGPVEVGLRQEEVRVVGSEHGRVGSRHAEEGRAGRLGQLPEEVVLDVRQSHVAQRLVGIAAAPALRIVDVTDPHGARRAGVEGLSVALREPAHDEGVVEHVHLEARVALVELVVLVDHQEPELRAIEGRGVEQVEEAVGDAPGDEALRIDVDLHVSALERDAVEGLDVLRRARRAREVDDHCARVALAAVAARIRCRKRQDFPLQMRNGVRSRPPSTRSGAWSVAMARTNRCVFTGLPSRRSVSRDGREGTHSR